MKFLQIIFVVCVLILSNQNKIFAQKYKISKRSAKNLRNLLHSIDGGEDRDSILTIPCFSEIENPNDSLDFYQLNFEKEDWKNFKQLLISIDSKSVMAELNRWTKYYTDYSKKYSAFKKDYHFWKKFHKEIYKIQIEYQFEDFHETERILYYIDLEARKKKMKEKIRRIKRTRDSLYKDSIAKIQPVVYGDSITTVVSDSIPN